MHRLDVKLSAEYGNMRTSLPASSLSSSSSAVSKTGKARPIIPMEYLREIAIILLSLLHLFSP